MRKGRVIVARWNDAVPTFDLSCSVILEVGLAGSGCDSLIGLDGFAILTDVVYKCVGVNGGEEQKY